MTHQKTASAKKKVLLLLSTISFLIVGGLIVIHISTYFFNKDFVSRAIRTEGTVVNLNYSKISKMRGSFSTTYSFLDDSSGMSYQYSSLGRWGEPGDIVSVWYDPDDPTYSRLSSPYNTELEQPDLWDGILLEGFLGFMFGLCGLALLFGYKMAGINDGKA